MDELPTQLDLDDHALTLKESCSALMFASPPPSPIRSIPSTPFQSATQIDLVSPSILDVSTSGTQLDERPINSQSGPDSCAGTQLDNEEFVYVDNDEDDHILTNRKRNESLDTSLFDQSTQGDDSPCPSPFRATQLDRSSPMPTRRRPSTPSSPSLVGTQLDNPSPIGRMDSPYSAPHSPSDFGGSATQLDVPMVLGLAPTQDDALIIKPIVEKKKPSSRRMFNEAGTMDDSFDSTFMSATQGDSPIVDGSDSLGSEATQMDEIPTVIDGEGDAIPLLSGRKQSKAKKTSKLDDDDRYDEDLPTQMDDEVLPSATSSLLLPFEKGEMYDPTPPFDEYSSFKFAPLPKSNLKEEQQQRQNKSNNNKRKRRNEKKTGTTKPQASLNESGGTDQQEEASNSNKKRRKQEPAAKTTENSKQEDQETVAMKKEANGVNEKGDKGSESPLKGSKKVNKKPDTKEQTKEVNDEEDEPKTVSLKEEDKKREAIPGALAVLVSLNKKFPDVPMVEKKDVVMGRHKSCTEGCKFSSAHISTRHCRFFVETGVEGPAIPLRKESEKGEESMSPKLHDEEKEEKSTTKKEDEKEEEEGEGSDDNSDTIPLCMYGDKCYRKNPQHFKQFRHPHLEKKGSKENQKTKKKKEAQEQEAEEEEKKKQEQETKTKEAEEKLRVCNYRVVLEDLSTNGTFVNEKLVGKGNKVVLQHGDEVSLVAPSSQLPNISIDIAMYRLEYTPLNP